MDQYRVTREIPLPYSFNNPAHESEGRDEDTEAERLSVSSRSIRRKRPLRELEDQVNDVSTEI